MHAFAVCTHDRGVPKLTAQLDPLMPDEAKTVSLEFDQSGRWEQVAQAEVQTLGWSAHFRIEDWDITQNVRYRVRHGKDATFEGLIQRDPIDKDVIVIGALSCNSSRTPGPRPKIVENLKLQNPALLFFAGDQSYHHTQHTFGWLEFGLQFRDILKIDLRFASRMTMMWGREISRAKTAIGRRMEDNDGREPIGYLPEIAFDGADRPVFQVIDESTWEIVYTVRHTTPKFRAPVYRQGSYTVKVGKDHPNKKTHKGLKPAR